MLIKFCNSKNKKNINSQCDLAVELMRFLNCDYFVNSSFSFQEDNIDSAYGSLVCSPISTPPQSPQAGIGGKKKKKEAVEDYSSEKVWYVRLW